MGKHLVCFWNHHFPFDFNDFFEECRRKPIARSSETSPDQLSRIFYDLLCVMTNWFCNLKKVILD